MSQPSATPQLIAELKSLGAAKYNLMLPETKAIATVIHPEEKITGLVYGRYVQERDKLVSRGVLIATDKRVVLLNKKPLFKQSDEISYQIISGVEYSRVAVIAYVTLHTRAGDIRVRTFNNRAAKTFVAAIEQRIF